MKSSKKMVALAAVAGILATSGVAAATSSRTIRISGTGFASASVNCWGGMTRLGHPFDEQTSVFPGDPAIHVELEYTVAEDFFRVEDIDTGSHAGTHLDVPSHFIEGGRSLEDFSAEEFVWPAYKIDVRGESFPDDQLGVADIQAFERRNGRIRPGSLVILQTGAEEFFGLDDPGDERRVDDDGNADNVDDLFEFENVGFSGEAVQWLFDNRDIAGVGSDAYGPDAATDENFDATFTALANDGVALVAIANLDSVSVNGDVIMAPAVRLTDGSGFSVDPIACHGYRR